VACSDNIRSDQVPAAVIMSVYVRKENVNARSRWDVRRGLAIVADIWL